MTGMSRKTLRTACRIVRWSRPSWALYLVHEETTERTFPCRSRRPPRAVRPGGDLSRGSVTTLWRWDAGALLLGLDPSAAARYGAPTSPGVTHPLTRLVARSRGGGGGKHMLESAEILLRSSWAWSSSGSFLAPSSTKSASGARTGVARIGVNPWPVVLTAAGSLVAETRRPAGESPAGREHSRHIVSLHSRPPSESHPNSHALVVGVSSRL